MDTANDLLTVEQAAPIIGVHPRQVRRYIADGSLPSLQVSDRIRLVRREDAERFRRPVRGNPEFGTRQFIQKAVRKRKAKRSKG